MTEEYKLNLEIELSSSPPHSPTICHLCIDEIIGPSYTINVKNPEHGISFCKGCYEQLVAAGVKLWMQIQSAQEISN